MGHEAEFWVALWIGVWAWFLEGSHDWFSGLLWGIWPWYRLRQCVESDFQFPILTCLFLFVQLGRHSGQHRTGNTRQ